MQTEIEIKRRKVSLNEIGYRLTDVWDQFQNGQMDAGTAMVNVKIGTSVVNAFRTKALVNDFNGVKNSIDDLWGDNPQKQSGNKIVKGKDVIVNKMIE